MAAEKTEGYWRTPDNLLLFYRFFKGHSSGAPIFIIHGYAEHSGRYEKLIDFLRVKTGRAVLSYDLRGHGRSGGGRGKIDLWERHWSDFCGLSQHVQSEGLVSTGKTILLGHSLGGLIALEGVSRGRHGIKGLILSSPCLGVRLMPGLRVLNNVVTRVFPHFAYERPVKTENLSSDPVVCRNYDVDPLILKKIEARTLYEMMKAGEGLEKSGCRLSVPVWFLAAGNERVVDLNRTLRIYAKLDAPFKKLKIFENLRHEIFNEVGNEIAYDTLLQAVEQIAAF